MSKVTPADPGHSHEYNFNLLSLGSVFPLDYIIYQ